MAMSSLNKRWTDVELKILRDKYPHERTCLIAKTLNRNVSSVQKMAQILGIKKTGEYFSRIRSENAENATAASIATRFQQKHGRASKPSGAYAVWKSMKQRCEYEKHKSYKNYGGRGIKVCEEWSKSFDAFLKSMGEPPNGKTIGRINGNGNYEPSNCRWETHKEQARNRSSNRLLTAFGETHVLAEWAEIWGIRPDTLAFRLNKGIRPEIALTTPVVKRKVRKANERQNSMV